MIRCSFTFRLPAFACALSAMCLLLIGCRSNNGVRNVSFTNNGECLPGECGLNSQPGPPVDRIRFPDIDDPTTLAPASLAAPLTSATELPDEFLPISLDQSIRVALADTGVLRSLGARVLNNPQATPGSRGPALQYTDPILGIEAALAAFDAQFNTGLNYRNNDQVFNNAVLGGGATELQQDLAVWNYGLQKTAATGTQFSLNGNVIYDDNNRAGNLFDSAFTTLFEAEIRQPLLQGAGLEFNRIAGPSARPGFRTTTGVLLARVNNDISIAQFEREVRDFVNEVVNAYWQLYLAYRNFETAKLARDDSLKTWNGIKAKFDNDLPGGEADKEARAREFFYQLQQQLAAAINGDTQNGTTGILQAEADLRRLLNLPQSDGLLLRPADEPIAAPTVYDWQQLVRTATGNRVELREQQWRIKQREMELTAARNFTQPRLDAVANYRSNGFGDTLARSGASPFDSALQTVADGRYNDWEVGLELNVPIGFRRESAGVRNSVLQLERTRAVYREQQKQILHGLGSALRRVEQTRINVDLARLRFEAASETVDSRTAAFEADAVPFDDLLDAQQRLADASRSYYRELVNNALATEAVALQTGNLLPTHGVLLGEQGRANLAGLDVDERKARVHRAVTNFASSAPGAIER